MELKSLSIATKSLSKGNRIKGERYSIANLSQGGRYVMDSKDPLIDVKLNRVHRVISFLSSISSLTYSSLLNLGYHRQFYRFSTDSSMKSEFIDSLGSGISIQYCVTYVHECKVIQVEFDTEIHSEGYQCRYPMVNLRSVDLDLGRKILFNISNWNCLNIDAYRSLKDIELVRQRENIYSENLGSRGVTFIKSVDERLYKDSYTVLDVYDEVSGIHLSGDYEWI